MAPPRPSRHGGLTRAWRVDGALAEVGFGAAVIAAAVCLGLLLRLAFADVLPGSLLFPALMVAGLVGGWRAGATAAALAIVTRFTIIRPRSDPIMAGGTANLGNLVMFLVAALVIVMIGAWVRRLLVRLEHSHVALSEQTLRYATLFDTVPDGFAVCEAIRDPDGGLCDYRVLEMNPALRRLLGVGPEAIGSRLRELPGRWTRWLELCDRVLTTGKPITFEHFYADQHQWRQVQVCRLEPERMAQFFFDITERKAAEARQSELFKELNHRVKNNLAMVAGLLHLQAKGAPESARDELGRAAERVRSIADVHAALTGEAYEGAVDLAAYLDDLVERLRRSLVIPQGVELIVDAQPTQLPVDLAVPLGMAVSELVTNAVKYAYPGGARGVIEVALRREGERLALSVRDEGVGLPDGVIDSGLGMRVVRSLAGQAGGELKVSGVGGARFEISLEDPAPVA